MGKPISRTNSRSIRIFLSSTFRDFGEERDLLVRRVFPALRARLKDRFVELVDVDLRWGITAEQAERGDVLPICLAEIDRARPFFVGMLGERYGWVPPGDAYSAELLERQPWLKAHQGGKSVTELEVLHGVLNNASMAGRAFFYFRSATYARKKGGEYIASSVEDAQRQRSLKESILKSRFPVARYADPQALAKRLERDLWKVLDQEFPADSIPDAFEREAMRHEAYAEPRRRLYMGGDRYVKAIAQALAVGRQRVLVEGASGGGKSALLANWLEAHRHSHPKDLVHEHYLGASADAAEPHALVRRLAERIRRQTASAEEVASDPHELLDSLPTWLATASAWAAKKQARWVIVLDSLNSLRSLRDLRWFPSFIPERVHMVVSCLEGDVREALLAKVEPQGGWASVVVKPLNAACRKQVLVKYLARFNKELPAGLLRIVLKHRLASNPLFLRTLAEELRLFGVHEELPDQIDHYLGSKSVDDLFGRVLERVEGDCGKREVREAMTAIWASRSGLTESEIRGLAGLVPATWASIRNALDEALLEANGRLIFAHDYLRIGVRDRYLTSAPEQAEAHRVIGRWFGQQAPSPRRAEEEPYQWREAGAWHELHDCLTDHGLFGVLVAERGLSEILTYWLAWEGASKGAMEKALQEAWRRWRLKGASYEAARSATLMEQLLTYAGRHEDFAVEVATLAATVLDKLPRYRHEAVMAMSNLAELHRIRAEHENALTWARKAIDEADSASAESVPCWVHYADICLALDRHSDAEDAYGQGIAAAIKSLGAKSAEATFASLSLAWLYYAQGDYLRAEPAFREAFESLSVNPGPRDPRTSQAANNLALLHFNRCRLSDAERLARFAWQSDSAMFGAEHWVPSLYALNLTWVMHAKGDVAQASTLCDAAARSIEKSLGPAHPLYALAQCTQGWYLQAEGDFKASHVVYESGLNALVAAVGDSHADLAVPLEGLGWLSLRQRDPKNAGRYFERAKALVANKYGEQHPGGCMPLCGLALVALATDDKDVALRLANDAVSISAKTLGADHLDTAQAHSCRAAALAGLGRSAEAIASLAKAHRARAKVLPREHPDLRRSARNLDTVKSGDGVDRMDLFFNSRRFTGSSIV